MGFVIGKIIQAMAALLFLLLMGMAAGKLFIIIKDSLTKEKK